MMRVLGNAVLVFVLLHGPNGHEIVLNSRMVTSMHAGPGAGNQLVTEDARCIINTADGKFVSVIETCDIVRELFRQSGRKPEKSK